ncbi:methyltransferase type 11 [Rhizobium sp. Root274]|uniref:small ribosomal subunit Rsm22 family protein n=1 Tax=unclassified Rhizobium TaxID=2613769 RepID=UPI0007122F18|nr:MULTISPECIES: small ribosomal subunit Rsm22 family protein [unclassified Rhizobium]KQW30954.1 methyltransferase type 11 [Rhizobium sp. Root1240]KRD32499.1 methyltransferase type 11 [Rhizobium sp. Root274]
MELPAALRSAVDQMLSGEPLEKLVKSSAVLSDRYRREVRDGRFHIDDALAAKAYLATRLPATFAAVRAAFGMVEEVAPDFAPTSLIDLGCGPGTALWAAADTWPSLASAEMIEASGAIRGVGEKLSRSAQVASRWQAGDVTAKMPSLAPADLITLAYVLDELPPATIANVTQKLWSLTKGMLVIIEPGTPAGWQRILTARDVLRSAGAHLVAPCPHSEDCPIVAPDWCHFSRRVARSRVHRLAKGAEVPWEDEKYIFIAASREPVERTGSRILVPPRVNGGVGRVKLCRGDGTAQELTLSKRDGEAFKALRRADWGDLLQEEVQG